MISTIDYTEITQNRDDEYSNPQRHRKNNRMKLADLIDKGLIEMIGKWRGAY